MRYGVLVDQIRHSVAIKIDRRLHLPVGEVKATTEAGKTGQSGPPRATVIVDIHLMRYGVLIDQIRHSVPIEIGHRHHLPVGEVKATTEAGKPDKRSPAVIVYIHLMGWHVLVDQVRRAVAVKIAASHQ